MHLVSGFVSASFQIVYGQNSCLNLLCKVTVVKVVFWSRNLGFFFFFFFLGGGGGGGGGGACL